MNPAERIGPWPLPELPDEVRALHEHIVRRLLEAARLPWGKFLTADQMRRKLDKRE